MAKFKVGDRVRCIAAHDGNSRIVGQKGTVRSVEDSLDIVAVEFDNYVNGHELQSFCHCKYGYGWNVAAHKLELISKPKAEHDTKIIIYRQGNKTIARYVVDKKVVTETCDTCSPEDTFSFITGAQLAFARFVQQYDAKPVLLKETLKNIEII